MRSMIDLGRGQQRGRLHMIDTPTSVDCGREVRLRRSLRTLVECMVPACCAFPPTSPDSDSLSTDSESSAASASASASATVTCTFFGQRNGRVSFCIQEDTKAAPLLLLEFAVPTSYLAREMQHGLLRVALESRRCRGRSLYDVSVWCMYCNGRKVGFAVSRQVTPADAAVLNLMQSVSVGAGLLPAAEDDGELLYLRASFDRVIGSADSESFHMRNPAGCSGQELSVFLLRS